MSDRKAAERRRHPRQKKRVAVRYGPGDLAHSGYTDDISDSGIHLRCTIIYPPHTVLVLQIDYPEKPVTVRGTVRWTKDVPLAFRRSLRGAMGIELAAQAGASPKPAAAEPPVPAAQRPSPPSGLPPDAAETELGGGSTSRRQLSTAAGNTYEVLLTEYRGAFYVRLFQLPRSEGSAEALFRASFWRREEAEAALKAFLKEH
jgi:hypothetical protein